MVFPFDFFGGGNKEEEERESQERNVNVSVNTNGEGDSNGIQWYTFYSEKEGREYCKLVRVGDYLSQTENVPCSHEFFFFFFFFLQLLNI